VRFKKLRTQANLLVATCASLAGIQCSTVSFKWYGLSL